MVKEVGDWEVPLRISEFICSHTQPGMLSITLTSLQRATCTIRYPKLLQLRILKLTRAPTTTTSPTLQPPLLSLGKALFQTYLMFSATFCYTRSAHEVLGLCMLIYKLEKDKPPVSFALHCQQHNSRDSELEEPLPTGQRSTALLLSTQELASSKPSPRELGPRTHCNKTFPLGIRS